MSDFFKTVWDVFNESDVSAKLKKCKTLYMWFLDDKSISFSSSDKIEPLVAASYANSLQVSSLHVKKQKPKDSAEREAMFLHSVAHIEFSAIDIALDACYRFRDLPREYYADWLEVANDEVRHFEMLLALLEKRGIRYGDYSVHDGLFVALQKTAKSLIERMAVLPRYMEANGLDANAHAISRLQAEGAAQDILDALHVILREEVSHVAKGDRWFKYACEQESKDASEYINIVKSHYPKAFLNSRKLNEEARLLAGFSKSELEDIKNLSQGRE